MPFLAQFGPEDQDLLSRLLARVSLGENTAYPGLPAPASPTIAGGPTTVNDLLLYWVHHGRIGIRPGIAHLDGATVHFTDGTAALERDRSRRRPVTALLTEEARAQRAGPRSGSSSSTAPANWTARSRWSGISALVRSWSSVLHDERSPRADVGPPGSGLVVRER